MDKKTALDLIKALQTLKDLNFQQIRSLKNYLVLISNLTIEWFQSHQQILMKISNDMNELMKHISNAMYIALLMLIIIKLYNFYSNII